MDDQRICPHCDCPKVRCDGYRQQGYVACCPECKHPELLPCACGCGKLVLGGYMEAAHPDDYRDERG